MTSRVGIVGDNDSRKSNLLRLLAGQEVVDNGSLTVMAPGGIGHLRQTLDLPASARVGDAVDHVLGELRGISVPVAERRRLHTSPTPVSGRWPRSPARGRGRSAAPAPFERARGHIGFLRQQSAPDDAFDARTLLAAFAADRVGQPDEHADTLLALGLFRAPDLAVPVRNLSVGQRRKLELARLQRASPGATHGCRDDAPEHALGALRAIM
ncbi:hypothetical protein [Streptomyces sp. NPDC054940]